MRLVSPENAILPLNDQTILKDADDKPLDVTASNVELSRLCLVKEIRRRVSDTTPPYGLQGFQDENQNVKKADNVEPIFTDRRVNLSIIWGLFRAAADYSEQNNIDSWYFLTNKALARVIGREGFKLHSVGESCEHAGRRYPFQMKLDEILSQVSSSEMASNVQPESYRLYSDYEKSLTAAHLDSVSA